MTQAELLRHLVDALDRLALAYMIVGSHASIYCGEPRFTQDIDVVVGLPGLLSGCRLLRERGRSSRLTRKDTDRVRFERRQRLPLLPGRDAYFARPEDVILYKLLYFSQGGSDRHLRDVAGMLAASGSVIDIAYVSRWATARGVGDLWNAARGGQTAV